MERPAALGSSRHGNSITCVTRSLSSSFLKCSSYKKRSPLGNTSGHRCFYFYPVGCIRPLAGRSVFRQLYIKLRVTHPVSAFANRNKQNFDFFLEHFRCPSAVLSASFLKKKCDSLLITPSLIFCQKVIFNESETPREFLKLPPDIQPLGQQEPPSNSHCPLYFVVFIFW